MHERMLTHEEAKAFYDRFGRKQDLQGFYENAAIEAAVRNGWFGEATTVFEFGCGTGKFAERLLGHDLPEKARYTGVDVSETMISLARERLSRFGLHAEVLLTDGSPRIALKSGTFNRFVTLYVLDLLTPEDARTVVAEARRLLMPGGLFVAASLTHGFTFFSRIVERFWTSVHGLRPSLVGGCRPISISGLIGQGWTVRYNERFSAFGVPSEVLVAERTDVVDRAKEELVA